MVIGHEGAGVVEVSVSRPPSLNLQLSQAPGNWLRRDEVQKGRLCRLGIYP